MTVIGSTLLIGACRQSLTPPPPKTGTVEMEPLERARQAMARRDYSLAVTLLRDVIARRPDDVEAHYRLAVTASHLDHINEASQEFAWVVTHGDPRSPEVQIARDWLASRAPGAIAEPSGPATTVVETLPSSERAMVSGRAIGPDGPRRRLQLFLKGAPESTVRDESHVLRTDQQGNFSFTGVVPGDYVLTDRIAGAATWRLRVSVGKGDRRVLELTTANQVVARDGVSESR